MTRFAVFVLASLAVTSVAAADHRSTPPGVTMERCTDVNIDDLQEAIAVEYQGQDDHRTMVTVVCRDTIATVRVLGPSHPKGRIVDVNIAGVDPVVLPRMIALIAVEMWTAPEVETNSISEPHVVARMDSVPPSKRWHQRPRLTVGMGLTSLHRAVQAGRRAGNVGATGSFAALSMQADWRILSWIGVTAKFTRSAHVYLNGLESLGQPVQWLRNEYGIYVPIVKQRYRINARYSAGRDEYQTRQHVFVDPEMAVLPDYYFDSIGFDLTYAVDERLKIGGATSLLFLSNDVNAFTSPRGYRWGLGLTYDVATQVRLVGQLGAASVSQINDATNRAYSDVMTTLEFGAQYLY